MKSQLFSLPDIATGLIWLVILLVISHFIVQKKKDAGLESKYYLLNIYFKFLFVTAFVMVYALLYNGGDTFAYYQGSDILNNLFFVNPENFLNEITSSSKSYSTNFSSASGYPPGWIYREEESYFISKVISFLMFVTFKSYWAISFILAFIMANVNYQLYVYVSQQKFLRKELIALAILFIPSVSFWCAGISKDTIVYIAILMGTSSSLKLINKESSLISISTFYLFIAIFLLAEIRTFLLLSLLVPIFFALTTRITNKLSSKPLLKFSLRIVFFGIGIGVISLYLTNSSSFGALSSENIINEAAVIQQDFAENKSYGADRYKLDIKDYTPMGLIQIAPQAIVAGIYRPFPWDSANLALVPNLLEGVILMFLSLMVFVKKDFLQRIKFVRQNEILVFCFFFALILAFMTGFSSSIYGVLVRLRAPLLPFAFLLLLSAVYGNYKNEKNGTDILNTESK